MAKKEKIGFVGLGLMGNPMALRLIARGHEMTVWNRTAERARPVLDAGAAWADSAAGVAARSDIVITMVTDSAASEEVARGRSGILEGAHPGLVLIDMSSIAPDSSAETARQAAGAGVAMLDAPVTGSVAAVEEGALGIMVGGPRETFDRCLPVFQDLGTKIVYAGPNGSGCTLKLINNLIMGIALEAVAEGLVLAAKVGLDPSLVMDITSVGGAQTAAMKTRGPRMIEADFAPRFSVANEFKDLTNALALAGRAQAPLPIAAAVRELYGAAIAAGKGGLDSSAVVTVL
ncbi:MAG TPA: NAD(P)-dependent oxidoreductase, partial [Chloroflexota bacterium]